MVNIPPLNITTLDKLLITHTIAAIKASQHNIAIHKVRAHTNILGNDEANKLAKQGAQKPRILETPFHLIGHQTPNWPSIPPTLIHHDSSIRNLKII